SLVFGVSNSAIREVRIASDSLRSVQSYFAAESGSEDVTYRLKNGLPTASSQTLSVGGATTTTAVSDLGVDGKEILSSGDTESLVRKVRTRLTVSSGASFNYGVQVGDGGFYLQNNSSISGNVYSNGSIVGSGSNIVKGDVVSAGSSGSISGVHATSSAYAHTISNSTIDKNAYYQSISGTTVSGTKYPNSLDQPKQNLAIPDSLIAQWESEAASGGTVGSPCPYKITNNTTIGPKKISCDLEISGGPIVTITGPLWVTGNITVRNTATLKASPSLGNKSVVLIADNPANRTMGSKINIDNNITFSGSGFPSSYILMISQNRSAEIGGNEEAIEVKNNIEGDLLVYAGHGEISLENTISLKEVSGYKVITKNSAEVVYSTGLANLLFTSGPGGSFSIDGWREVK
ncbi:MAG: hypothetical protein AAB355_00515, partial [Patescibacteria group bacterium]